VNWLGVWYFTPAKIEQYFLLARWGLWYPLIGRLSELTALILLLTSNNFSQKFLGSWWKRIQRLSYVYFITGGIMAAQLFPFKVYPLMLIVGILYFIAFLKNRKR
jgi:DMSO/TMAO reductase YedYZ heme-binding membrane subunit